MRLINTSTYVLKDYFRPGPYAILSHAWRDDEVSFDEFTTGKGRNKKGFKKIQYLCAQAQKDNLKYAWIDTVCINKASSAELSEAINSMYKWYQKAKWCYVYLDDASSVEDIEKSYWLTRGWTLQEMLAPKVKALRFYGIDWLYLGTKLSLLPQLVRWTQVDQIVLERPTSMKFVCAATRIRWACNRRTTRPEDIAYCLLGILDINMPLLYGEGIKAFRRLQEEVVRQLHDISIILFNRNSGQGSGESGLFATSPQVFGCHPKILPSGAPTGELTSNGISFSAQLYEDDTMTWIVLGYRFEFHPNKLIALPVPDKDPPYSIRAKDLTLVPVAEMKYVSPQQVLVRESKFNLDVLSIRHYICRLDVDEILSQGFKILYAEPTAGINSWNADELTSEVTTYEESLVRRFAFVQWLHQEAFMIYAGNGTANSIHVRIEFKPRAMDCTEWLDHQGMLEDSKALAKKQAEVANIEKMLTQSSYSGLRKLGWKQLRWGSKLRSEEHTIPLLESTFFREISFQAIGYVDFACELRVKPAALRQQSELVFRSVEEQPLYHDDS